MTAFYKVLSRQEFTSGDYSIVPIRYEDRLAIMKWRNEQMYHLRQAKPLTAADQENYFRDVVSNLFEDAQPGQILFSYLENGKCIGYGGLVHINGMDKNAEISFIMDTALEKDFFGKHWSTFLGLIEQVAFTELQLHKVFTYAFDIRHHLYPALESKGFKREAELKEHCLVNDAFRSVIIHSKINHASRLRDAAESDAQTTFQWTNNPQLREFSYNKEPVLWKDHIKWFSARLASAECEYFILEVGEVSAGSLRFDLEGVVAKINYLIDPAFGGKGLGTEILLKGMNLLKEKRPEIETVCGYVFPGNKASVRIFEKLSFGREIASDSEIKYSKQLQ